MKLWFYLLLACLCALPACAQSSPSEQQTLQSILAELRAMHRDARLSTSTQILLSELQTAQASLDQALARQDKARADLAQTQAEQMGLRVEYGKVEEDSEKSQDAALKERLNHLKADRVRLTALEESQREQLRLAETRARTLQGEVDQVQGELKSLMSRLGPAD